MPHEPCITITSKEWEGLFSRQTPGAVFCNRCEQKGRFNFDRHLRERANGMCPCCRREYQAAYYKAKKVTGSGKDVLKLLYQIKKQREQVYTWFKLKDVDLNEEIRSVHLPELNRIERLVAESETTWTDLILRHREEFPPPKVPDFMVPGLGMQQLMEIGKEFDQNDPDR